MALVLRLDERLFDPNDASELSVHSAAESPSAAPTVHSPISDVVQIWSQIDCQRLLKLERLVLAQAICQALELPLVSCSSPASDFTLTSSVGRA